MKEFKGTKGKWEVEKFRKIGEINNSILEVNSDDYPFNNYSFKVCKVWNASAHRNDQNIDYETSLANAKLIAAAPDLLEACLEFVRKCDVGEARSKKSYAQMKKAINKALKP